MSLFDGADGVVVDVDDSLGIEPNAAATDAPTTARKARETSARLARVAGLAPLAMSALRCGTQPVAESTHGTTGKHGYNRGVAEEDRQKPAQYESGDCDTDMNGVLWICHA